MTKDELLERLDNWSYQPDSLALIKKLIKGTDETDPDFKAALDDDMAEEIVMLTLENDDSSLIKLLNKNDCDIFNNYRFAEVAYRSDFKDEEDFKENSGAFYNGEPDCLMYNEDKGVYVISW